MAPMTLTFEITTKVEALQLDGGKKFTFQGLFRMNGEGDGLNLAMPTDEQTFIDSECGDVMTFEEVGGLPPLSTPPVPDVSIPNVPVVTPEAVTAPPEPTA